MHFARSIVPGYHSFPKIKWGSIRGRREEKWGSFRGRFGNHFRVGDHFGGCTVQTSDMRHRTTDNGQWVWSQIVDKMFDSSFRVVVFVVCSWASSLFYVATELEGLLLRTRQITVAVSVDDRSLQKRFFEFTGCWGRPVMDIPQEMLELYLEHHFTPVQIAQLFSVSTKAIRKRLEEA